jgi:hypothetical protein
MNRSVASIGAGGIAAWSAQFRRESLGQLEIL